MLLNILQCSGQSHNKGLHNQSVNGAKIKKLVFSSLFEIPLPIEDNGEGYLNKNPVSVH